MKAGGKRACPLSDEVDMDRACPSCRTLHRDVKWVCGRAGAGRGEGLPWVVVLVCRMGCGRALFSAKDVSVCGYSLELCGPSCTHAPYLAPGFSACMGCPSPEEVLAYT